MKTESKIKTALKSFSSCDKKLKILIICALAGALLIAVSEIVPQGESVKNESQTSDYGEYVNSLENKTASLLQKINGVGRCSVMITLDESDENVFAKNTNEKQSDGSYSKDDEYVLYEGQSGETPALVKRYFPKVKGVAVVCDGADNDEVRESVVNSVSSLFGISVSKISVSEYKG